MKETIIAITSLIFGALFNFFEKLFGGFDTLFVSLVLLMTMDFISGLMKAIKNKNLDSQIGIFGITKKAFILLIVALSVVIDKVFKAKGVNVDIVRDVVIMFYIINEIISVLENAGEFIPIPEKIKEVLAHLHTKEHK